MFDEKTNQEIVKLRKSGIKPKAIDKKLNLHDVQGVREVCSKRGVSEPVRINKDEWVEELTLRAEAYWKANKTNHVPQKGSLAYLLIPKYGLDLTQKILTVKNHVKSDGIKMLQLIFGKVE